MTQYCFGIPTWSGNAVVPITISEMERTRRGRVVVPEDGEDNRAKIFAQSLEGWRIEFIELGLSEKEVYVKIEAMVTTHLSLLNAAEAVEYTRESFDMG
jgi:hypothetical protein